MSFLLGTWQHQYIPTNGINLNWVRQGKGKSMLMLHGFREFWYSWRHQIIEFATDYQVVTVDLRGYNDSDKPDNLAAYKISELVQDVKGIINHFRADRCILVGHDGGGFLAGNFAYTYPEMVEKLIVLNLPHSAKFAAGLKTWRQRLKSCYIFWFQTGDR